MENQNARAAFPTAEQPNAANFEQDWSEDWRPETEDWADSTGDSRSERDEERAAHET